MEQCWPTPHHNAAGHQGHTQTSEVSEYGAT